MSDKFCNLSDADLRLLSSQAARAHRKRHDDDFLLKQRERSKVYYVRNRERILAERRVGYVPRKLSEEELLSMTDEKLENMRAQRERAQEYYKSNREKLLSKSKARYHILKNN
jgi:uncharacterized protein YqeY